MASAVVILGGGGGVCVVVEVSIQRQPFFIFCQSTVMFKRVVQGYRCVNLPS